jgi:hypothetical protein
MVRLPLALLAGLVLVLPGLAQAADPVPPAGNWKVFLPMRPGGNAALWIVKLEQKESKWTGSVLAGSEGAPKTTLENLRVTKEMLSFDLKLPAFVIRFEGKVPAAKATKVYGTGGVRSDVVPMELEQTTLTSLDSFSLNKETLAKGATGTDAVRAGLTLLRQAEARKATPAEVRSWADKTVKGAELYGPRFQQDIVLVVVGSLNQQKGFEKIALQYAQRAERALEPKTPPAAQKKVLDALADALEKAGKEEDAKEVRARIKKLDFRVKPKVFAGRKAKSDRVVLVELFTGAQCPPCVAADLAFDALGKTFKTTEVIRLQYHLHIPRPDPLTSPDSEARAKFYESVEGTPALLINGKPGPQGGGDSSEAPEKYTEYVDAIEPQLERPSKAEIKVSAALKGNKLTITAEVSKLTEMGPDVRLRLALVEEEVAYKGTNGLGVHQHVVRAMPGGVDGTPLKEKTGKKTVTVDLEKLRKDLKNYLTKYAEKRPFPSKDQPLDLKKLRVIAFVQNDESLEVLQAVQTDVK